MARQDGDATTGLDEDVGEGPDEQEDARKTAMERKQAKSRGESMSQYESREDAANFGTMRGLARRPQPRGGSRSR